MPTPFNPFESLIPPGNRAAATAVAPTAAAPVQQRRLRLKPKDEPAAQTPAQARADELDVQLKEQTLATNKAKADRDKQDTGDAIKVLLTELGSAADAHRLSRTSNTATGWGNALFSHVPATDAKTMNGYLTTLGGNIAFSALQKMRENSPTGGALGNVTVPELEMLQSSETSLDPQREGDAFRRSMATVLESRKRILFKIPGGKEAYREWRKNWLGYDPYAKEAAGKGKGKAKGGKGGWSIEEVR